MKTRDENIDLRSSKNSWHGKNQIKMFCKTIWKKEML